MLTPREIASHAPDLSGENLLINGDMGVWQRGNTFSTVYKFTADRWKVNTNASAFSVAKSPSATAPVNGNNIMRLTLTTKGGSFSDLNVANVLESSISRPHAGKDATLSLIMRRNSLFTTGKATINIYSGTGVDESDITTGRVIFEKDIDFSELDTLNFTKFSLTASIPSDCSQLAVLVRFKDATVPDGSYIDFTNVKLEEGSVATPFVPRSYGEELDLCQRYYESIDATFSGQAYNTTNSIIAVKWKKKRVVPTPYWATGTGLVTTSTAVTVTVSGTPTASQIAIDGCYFIVVASSASLVAGDATLGIRPTLTVDAEL